MFYLQWLFIECRGACWVIVGRGERSQGGAAAFQVLSVQWWGGEGEPREGAPRLREQELCLERRRNLFCIISPRGLFVGQHQLGLLVAVNVFV